MTLVCAMLPWCPSIPASDMMKEYGNGLPRDAKALRSAAIMAILSNMQRLSFFSEAY